MVDGNELFKLMAMLATLRKKKQDVFQEGIFIVVGP